MVTGSRLYGTHRPDSDWDIYEIYDKLAKNKHSIKDGDDIQRWSMSTLMKVADKGGHNALDLLFAPSGWPEVDFLEAFRANYVANPWNCYKRFTATIEAFLERGDNKGLMHAQRMQDNLDSVMRTGRYNPVWKRN